MKCLKCNYTSFDYSPACPKCGNDNSAEQTRLRLAPNKPNPPFFLASLIGKQGSSNLDNSIKDLDMYATEAVSEASDDQGMLFALDDMQTDETQQDSPEPQDPATDEILFDLDSITEEEADESLHKDPLDKNDLWDSDDLEENLGTIEFNEIPEETSPEKVDEMALFLDEEPQAVEVTVDDMEPFGAADTSEETDTDELLLTLNDLPENEPTSGPPATSQALEDEVADKLKEMFDQESQPAETENPDEKGFWNSDEINEQIAAYPEKTEGKATGVPGEETSDDKKNEEPLFDVDLEPLDLELSFEDMEKEAQ